MKNREQEKKIMSESEITPHDTIPARAAG